MENLQTVNANTSRLKTIVIALISGACASCLCLASIWYLHQQFQSAGDSSSSNLVQSQLDQLQQLVQTPSKVEGILDLEGIEDNWVRTLALDELIVSATTDELIEYFTDSRSLSDKPVRRSVQKEILRRIAVADPVLALEQVETVARFRRDEFRTVVYIEWSSYDLQGLVRYARDLGTSGKELVFGTIVTWRQELTEEQLRTIGLDLGFGAAVDEVVADVEMSYKLIDPQTQWEELIQDSIADSDQSEMMITVALAWMNQEGIAALDTITKSMPRGRARSEVLGELLLVLATTDGSEAFRRLVDNYDPTLQSFAKRLVDMWTSENPEASFAAISGIKLPALKRTLLEKALTTWARTDTTSFQRFSASVPQEFRELHNQAALQLAILQEPKEAAQQLFGDEQLGSVTHARALISSWSIRDPMAVFEWALTNPHVEAWRDELVKDSLWSLSTEDLEHALTLALNQPVGVDSVGFEASIIDVWSTRDPVKAKSLLAKARPGVTRLAAYRSVGSAMIDIGEHETFMQLGQDLSESDRKSYYEPIAEQLVWSYPQEAYGFFEQTDSNLVKSILAKRLYVYSHVDKEGKLSETQKALIEAQLTEVDRQEISDETALINTLEFLFE